MDERILIAHGEGGRRTRDLINDTVLQIFPSLYLKELSDSAIVPQVGTRVVFTTDSHVVDPYIFPGGDIGTLSVCGTVNDLAVCGAVPKFLSFALIIEEGLPIDSLRLILSSAQAAAEKSNVEIVTGDTKVVPRGQADKIYINTSGIGWIDDSIDLTPLSIQSGDKIIVSGSIGNHGAAIMAERLKLNIDQSLCSDVKPLIEVCQTALACGGVRVMRDATRGGLATVLNEFAGNTEYAFVLNEEAVPVSEPVSNLCEVIGAEPYYLANEGTAAIICASDTADAIVTELHRKGYKEAAVIGSVTHTNRKGLYLKTSIGTTRILSLLSGEQFPRIC